MILPKNPFNPGLPSDPQAFVGRENLIRRLEAAIFDTHHQALVSLVGLRRIGKTSLLKKVFHYWNAQQRASCLMFDCEEFASRPPRCFLNEILQALPPIGERGGQAKLEDPWDELSASLALLEKRVVLILDEFDSFAGPTAQGFDASFFSRLRSLLVSDKSADKLTLLVATRCSLAEYSWAPEVVGSPFINIAGYFLVLGLLTPSESRQLLAPSLPFLDMNEIDLLLRLAGPHPHFLHVAGSEAWHLKVELAEINQDERTEFEPAETFEDFESRLRARFRQQASGVFRQLISDLSLEMRFDLYVRSVLQTGDLRLEEKLRSQLLLDNDGNLLSEGLRSFCVADDVTLRAALEARFAALPREIQSTLSQAALTGDSVKGIAAAFLSRFGWLGPGGTVRDEVRLWVPFLTKE